LSAEKKHYVNVMNYYKASGQIHRIHIKGFKFKSKCDASFIYAYFMNCYIWKPFLIIDFSLKLRVTMSSRNTDTTEE